MHRLVISYDPAARQYVGECWLCDGNDWEDLRAFWGFTRAEVEAYHDEFVYSAG